MKNLVLISTLVIGAVGATAAFALDETPAAKPAVVEGADNFYRSDKVTTRKVTFNNQYGMKVAGNLFLPRGSDAAARLPAIIVGHPMGAVKEQSSNLYAQKLAEQGFVTLAIDLSFWGESEGKTRNLVAPEIYAEDFSAAKIDPRMKAVATVSMYDMGSAARNGLNKSVTAEQRKQMIAAAAEQRYAEFAGGETVYVGGTTNALTAETDPVQREFFDFYRTPRGEFTPKGSSPERTTKPTLTSVVRFTNYYPLERIEELGRPLLFITGTEAHSREFSEDAYQRAAEPKELYWVKGANHVDLYDRVNLIPFDKLATFFRRNL